MDLHGSNSTRAASIFRPWHQLEQTAEVLIGPLGPAVSTIGDDKSRAGRFGNLTIHMRHTAADQQRGGPTTNHRARLPGRMFSAPRNPGP
jgi:hypothetical protein